jgi:hypothetical protein
MGFAAAFPLFALVAVVTASTVSVDLGVSPALPVEPMKEEVHSFSVDFDHKESTTSTVKFQFHTHVPTWMQVKKHNVQTTIKGSSSVLHSPDMAADEDSFKLTHLMKGSQLKICLVTTVSHTNASSPHEEEITNCFDSYTSESEPTTSPYEVVTDESGMIITTTEGPATEFSIRFEHKESTTSSVKFFFHQRIPEWMNVEKHQILTQIVGSESVLHSPEIDGAEDMYEVENLEKDNQLKICVVTTVTHTNSSDRHEEVFRNCFHSFTIPYIRNDSLYILIAVVAVLAALVIIGICGHARAVARAQAAAEEEEEEDKKEQ